MLRKELAGHRKHCAAAVALHAEMEGSSAAHAALAVRRGRVKGERRQYVSD
jgi:hypothetical protein